jgi:hypothetical protein
MRWPLAAFDFAAVKSTANDDGAARGRLKSCGPGASMLASKGNSESSLRSRRWRKIVVSRAVAKEPVHRGERGIGRSNHCVRNAGCIRRDRGDDARVLSTFAHEAADALAHPAFRAPSLKGEAMTEFRAPPRRHNNRGDGARTLSALLIFARTGQAPRAHGCLKTESKVDEAHAAATPMIVITGLDPVIHVLLAKFE